MRKQILSMVNALCFLMGILTIGSFSCAEGPVSIETMESNLDKGDGCFFDGRMDEALNIYESVLSKYSQSYDTLWRLSRYYISSGMAMTKIKDKKKKWRIAEDFGRRAITVRPGGAEGHLYLAIAIGKVALFSSSASKVKLAEEIKEEAEKAVELDPSQQKAYLALGSWHRNAATASALEKQLAKMFFGEVPKGSIEESEKLLMESIRRGGDNVRNYYELALTYEARGKYGAAKIEFENALNAKPVYPEDNGIKQDVQKILSKSRYK